MLRLARLTLVIALALTLGSAAEGCGGQAADPSGTAFALLANNRLVAVRIGDGAVVAENRLAPAPPAEILAPRYPGHQLALSGDGRTLFALAPQTTAGEWAWYATPVAPLTLVNPVPGASDHEVPCGERLALGPGPVLIVAQTIGGVVGFDLPGRLLLLDPATGRERGRVETPSPPMDVLVVPPIAVAAIRSRLPQPPAAAPRTARSPW